ncbi:hypothetical protein [Thiorhodospira sibirica]|uniref:hypothetical protein n=1 Tax=Thiorhodospira sibirica TaxID=154347 RepID=UPI00022C2DF2|nr:hypothetical protein [Thiorhodospira sibirica]
MLSILVVWAVFGGVVYGLSRGYANRPKSEFTADELRALAVISGPAAWAIWFNMDRSRPSA